MEIVHDFSPGGDLDPVKGRLDQLEMQLVLCQKALGHDLPNQMVALQGLARMLETELGPDVSPDTHTLVVRLAALAKLADENMRALAALSKLCRDPGPVETLNVGDVVREAAVWVRILFRGQDVEYHLHEDMPVVAASRAPLYHVFTQLLRNAFQAAVTGQKLAIEVGASRVEGGVELWLRDNGGGMGESQLGQLRATLAGERGAGAGLGLVLVRQIVAGWRGAVRIRSETGQGTTVTILARAI
jgi:signal transduction histidine kinase